MHGHAMNDVAPERRAWMEALAQDSRLAIARALGAAPRSVGELAGAIGLSQSCTTRHVQALVEAGVARSRRDGKRVRVELRHEAAGLAELLAWLGIAWTAPRGRPDDAAPRRARRARAHPSAPRPRANPAQSAAIGRIEEGPATPGGESGIPAASPTPSPPAPRHRAADLDDFLL